MIVVDDGSRRPGRDPERGGRGRGQRGAAAGQRRPRGGQEHRPGGGRDAAGGVPRLGLRARARLAGRAAAALRRSRGGRRRPAHRAARGRAHLAGAVRGGELHPGHGPPGQHRPAGIAGAVRSWRRPGRPQGGRRDRFRRGHAGGGGRRLRLAARRGRLAGALRARGRDGAPAPGAAARVVRPAEGLRDVRGRARSSGTRARSARSTRRRGPRWPGWRRRSAIRRPASRSPATGTALLARRLAQVTGETWPRPAGSAAWRLAVRQAAGGTLAAGRPLGSAISRTWWPVALPAAIAVRRLRLPLAALVLAPPLLDWLDRRPPLDPARYVAARLLDDAGYSLGVWQGCAERRTVRPLLPVLRGRDRHLCRPRLNSAGTMMSSGDSSWTEDRPSASSVESMPPRSTSKTFLTPAEPLAASPHR